jgi:flagellar protein FliS
MHVSNPWKSYRKIATHTAPPGQLVLMLYEGALRFLEKALPGFGLDDPAESNMVIHNNLQRAQEIIRELNLALNMELGGDCAANLRRLYDYFDRRLWESDLKKTREGVDEVIGHLTVLRDAWAAMLNNPQGVPLTEGQPSLALAAG